jgi:hypothetical protein
MSTLRYPPTTLLRNVATTAWRTYINFLALVIVGFVLFCMVSVVMYAREIVARVQRVADDVDVEIGRVEAWRVGVLRPVRRTSTGDVQVR